MFRISGGFFWGGVPSSGVLNVQNFWSSWGGGSLSSECSEFLEFWRGGVPSSSNSGVTSDATSGKEGGYRSNTTRVTPPPQNFDKKLRQYVDKIAGGAGGTPPAVTEEDCLVTFVILDHRLTVDSLLKSLTRSLECSVRGLEEIYKCFVLIVDHKEHSGFFAEEFNTKLEVFCPWIGRFTVFCSYCRSQGTQWILC